MASSPQPDPPSIPSPNPNPNPNPSPSPSTRRQRLPRACTSKPKKPAAPAPPRPERRRREKAAEEEPGSSGRVITTLLPDPIDDDFLPVFKLRSMWQLASVLNFLHVFRPLLNIVAEFTAEELELALICPNSILDDIHMPLLKSIPPVTRMAMGPGTWVTVLCRKLRDWWHWVAEGETPIVADHGAEIEAYKQLDPATRLIILKAICDIRVEQEDTRNYIDLSLKRGIQLSLFRKERVGGDSYGISYWYEDDPVIGHRLYREIRKVEAAKTEEKKKTEPKKLKRKGRPAPPEPPVVTYLWETVATNLDEFQQVSDKLFESKNRTEVSLAKKLKIDYLPEIEKIHKMNIAIMQKKERLMKKQQREALLLDSYLHSDGLSAAGRALRHRKNVTYTFDDYDRSINEAIKLTKKNSPDQTVVGTGTGTSTSTRRIMPRHHDPSANGKSNVNSNGPTDNPDDFHESESPKSEDYYEEMNHDDEGEEGEEGEPLDRSNRRRKRPRRYADDFVGPVYEAADSDDDIIGEAVYDDSYLQTKKQKTSSGSSEEEYKLESDDEEENQEEDYVEEEEEYSVGSSEEEFGERNRNSRNSRNRRSKYRNLPMGRSSGRVGRDRKGVQKGVRRSRRSTRGRINYRKYEVSETDTDSEEEERDADVAYSDEEEEEEEEENEELSSSSKNEEMEANEEMEEDDYEDNNDNNNNNDDGGGNDNNEGKNEEGMVEREEEKEGGNGEEEKREERESPDGVPRRFLDLNELATDGPDLSEKDDGLDDKDLDDKS